TALHVDRDTPEWRVGQTDARAEREPGQRHVRPLHWTDSGQRPARGHGYGHYLEWPMDAVKRQWDIPTGVGVRLQHIRRHMVVYQHDDGHHSPGRAAEYRRDEIDDPGGAAPRHRGRHCDGPNLVD